MRAVCALVATLALALAGCEGGPTWLGCPATVVAGERAMVTVLWEGTGSPIFVIHNAVTNVETRIDDVIDMQVSAGASGGYNVTTFIPTGPAGETYEVVFHGDGQTPVCRFSTVAADGSASEAPASVTPEVPPPIDGPCAPPMSCGPSETTTTPGS